LRDAKADTQKQLDQGRELSQKQPKLFDDAYPSVFDTDPVGASKALADKTAETAAASRATAATALRDKSDAYAKWQTGVQKPYDPDETAYVASSAAEAGFNDSLKGEEQKNKAQMDLRAKDARAKQDDDDREDMYAGMRQHQTLPHGEIPPAPQNATVGSMIPNQNAASHVAKLFAPGVSTPKSSFKDAIKSVAQSSTPNVPQTEPVKDEDNSEARLRVTRSYNADNAARSYDAKQEMLRKRAEREAREREDAQRNTTPKIGKVNPISPY